jgi:hypothetical protein
MAVFLSITVNENGQCNALAKLRFPSKVSHLTQQVGFFRMTSHRIGDGKIDDSFATPLVGKKELQ